MGLILSAPVPAPFVRQVAMALYEHELLEGFSTGAADSGHKPFWRQAAGLARSTGLDIEAFYRRRRIPEIPGHLVRSEAWRDILRTLVARWDRDGRLSDILWERMEKGFDRRVATQLNDSNDGIYGYEHACHDTFQRARELGLKCFYDVPSPDASIFSQVLLGEFEKFPELKTPYLTRLMREEPRRTRRRHAEWALADRVFAASSFTKTVCGQAGLDTDKIQILPLGAPPPVARAADGGTKRDEPLRCLWAGTFSMRKGAHYAIEAWRTLRPGPAAQLMIFGKIELPARFFSGVDASIHIQAPVEHDRILTEMQRSDVLLFPTLFDGFGMVIAEALAQGLPVITTTRAGAADLIEEGCNGWIVPPCDSEALVTVLQYCLSNRSQLKAMRSSAAKKAGRWQWSDYRSALAAAIRREFS